MKNKQKLIILTILFTTNNILYSLTSLEGKVFFWTSLGSKKIEGSKKLTPNFATNTTNVLIKMILNFNFKYTYLKLKGFNKSKKLVLKILTQSPLKILLISDKTLLPHNGCRKAKIRRI